MANNTKDATLNYAANNSIRVIIVIKYFNLSDERLFAWQLMFTR